MRAFIAIFAIVLVVALADDIDNKIDCAAGVYDKVFQAYFDAIDQFFDKKWPADSLDDIKAQLNVDNNNAQRALNDYLDFMRSDLEHCKTLPHVDVCQKTVRDAQITMVQYNFEILIASTEDVVKTAAAKIQKSEIFDEYKTVRDVEITVFKTSLETGVQSCFSA